MIRFFADPHDISKKHIKLSSDDSKHIRSLRLRPDELIIVCDGDGSDYICKLGERSDGTYADIIEKRVSKGEPSVLCKAYIAYAKGDRLDFAVQKSVELGVNKIVLFESERCVAVPNDIPKKITRLQRIAFETAKQSDRGIIPEVTSGGYFAKMLDDAIMDSNLSILFYECEENLHIKDVLAQHFSLHDGQEINTKPISLITGPEGGFEPREAELAKSKGIKIASLGSRVLRSETAPVVALTAIMYETGNL